MTNAEKAIEFIRKIQIDVSALTEEEIQATIDVLNMAISALEKRGQKKPATNADRIRAMTNEQLSQFLHGNVGCWDCPIYNFCAEKNSGCEKVWLDWLKQEVKDGH